MASRSRSNAVTSNDDQRRHAEHERIVLKLLRCSAALRVFVMYRPMTIKTVGVVGAGTMGSGIAQAFAQAGFAVRLVDVAQPMLVACAGFDREEPRKVRRERHAAGQYSRGHAGATHDRDDARRRSSTPTTSSRPSSRTATPSARCSPSSTRSRDRTSSSRRTRRRSRSPRSAPPRRAPSASSACTS